MFSSQSLRLNAARAFVALFAVAVLPLPAAVAQCTVAWQAYQPNPRSGAACAYDSARNVVVLFGGYDGVRNRETWEWNGTTWTLRSTTGPTAREGHAIAYDPARAVTVLFGGFDSNGARNDTWEWNGTTWTSRAPTTSPTARYNHAMCYHTGRGIVLFGGFDGFARRSDTYEYNGTTWTVRPISGPSAREGHAMAFDIARSRTVLVGGNDGLPDDETWEYSGVSWTRRALGDPLPVRAHSIAFDSTRNRTVLFGGDSNGFTGETWEWSGTAWALRSTGGPTPRYGHCSAYDVARQRTVVFGGLANTGYDGETWTWNGSAGAWSLAAGVPTPRSWPAMTFDSNRNRVVLFGGQDDTMIVGDTWEAGGGPWMPVAVGGPPPRYFAQLEFDSLRNECVLFGGSNGGPLGDTWVYNGSAWTQRMVSGPSPRQGHGMAFDRDRGVIVLFGGDDGNRRSDTWEWNGVSWAQRAVAGPSGRYWHAMGYDPVRRVTLLFGGLDDVGLNRQTWEFNGSAWMLRSSSGPSARSGSAMAFDTSRGRMVLFGGYDGIADADTWEWTGTAWTILPPGGPLPRSRHGMTFDAARGFAVMFGGTRTGVGVYGDSWRFGPTGTGVINITQQPAGGDRCPGQSITFSVTATGQAPITYQWRKNGVNIPGATSSTYSINPVALADSGTYSCALTNTCGTAISNPAVLTVSNAPTITQQPQSQTACQGQQVMFSVSATGGQLAYQWRKNTVDIPGATQSTYTIAAAQVSDSGDYDVVVSSSCGFITSAAATLTISLGPNITQHPQSQTGCQGQPLSLTVVATGVPPLSYQWRKDNVNIPGATSATYTIPAVSSGDAGQYYCVVTSPCGIAFSNPATVTVSFGATITQQPQSQAACGGQPATLSVGVTGAPPITYQWRRNGTPIAGATQSTYQIAAVTPADAGDYTVVVSNPCGDVFSEIATLTVSVGPAITQHPSNQNVCEGQPASFSVIASGSPLNYQWRLNGNPISGANGATYAIAATTPAHAGTYSVVVSNSCGTATSNNATLTVRLAPGFTQQPQPQDVCVGGTATFSVSVTGTGPFGFQWQRDGQDLFGANDSTLVIDPVQATDVGNYRCVVTAGCGQATSNAAALTIGGGGPTITQQPRSVSSCVGRPASFSVTAQGAGLSYQWRLNNNPIPGATTATYAIASVASGDFGTYTVLVSLGSCS
ncbi:MAG: immunoglobulin domain-containing protein, partial [Phycisphaerae bacterium]